MNKFAKIHVVERKIVILANFQYLTPKAAPYMG